MLTCGGEEGDGAGDLLRGGRRTRSAGGPRDAIRRHPGEEEEAGGDTESETEAEEAEEAAPVGEE